ncbi:hypothetical protein CDL12_23517 [Handroanthus impetiginosus]|uniref:Uncharacterized protein n=1 Tax=Handroanthus impetiginosus TaxID=429701 RepID=A0A2G9GFG1_9LAMI|nr:hypothetical protein CDL12_23517 [Handroanthus impetiginosus]
MERDEESGSPGWSASFFMQTTEDVTRAFAAAAAAAAASRSPRPSVVYSSKHESDSQLQRLKHHVSRMLKGLASPPEVKTKSLQDHRVWKKPSKLFESMVVVGLPPSSDIQPLQNMYSAKMSEGSGGFRSALGGQPQSHVEPILEPQILFVYPQEKRLPLKYEDLFSFCFPAGVEVKCYDLFAFRIRFESLSFITCFVFHFSRVVIVPNGLCGSGFIFEFLN